MRKSILTIITVAAFLSIVRQSKLDDAGNSGSNFATLSMSNYYVDKTRLLRAFFAYYNADDPSVKVITAPTGFGKSTVIDMVKRFFSIVYVKGVRLAGNTTRNFMLFRNRKLRIAKDHKLLHKHMGQHPVIHIDYKPLHEIRNFNTLLGRLRAVVRATFGEHAYLSDNATLFPTDADKAFFLKHCSPIGAGTLDRRDIQNAFRWLSELLFQQFGRKVIVLVDEYDAYDSNVLFKETASSSKIADFAASICERLLDGNPCVERALLTGASVVRSTSNAHYYPFAEKHQFKRYYGFTQREVNRIWNVIIPSKTKLVEKRAMFDKYYNKGPLLVGNRRVYSPLIVMNCLDENKDPC